jgi:hypothetical protein
MKTSVLLLMVVFFSSCSITDKRKEKIVNRVPNEEEVLLTIAMTMDEQLLCWNAGEIDCFMEAYWKSDSLVFIGKSGVNYGWQKTLDNYRNSYPDAATMGKLTFENEIMHFLDAGTIQVIGKWHLARELSLGDLTGYYSLIWQVRDGKWVIISDHSS